MSFWPWACTSITASDDDNKDVIASSAIVVVRTCAISDVVFRSTARLLRLLVLFILRSRFMIMLCSGPYNEQVGTCTRLESREYCTTSSIIAFVCFLTLLYCINFNKVNAIVVFASLPI